MIGGNPAFERLVAVAARADPAAVADLDPPALGDVLELARWHRVAGAVVAALDAGGVPLPPEAAAVGASARLAALRALRALGRVAAALDDAGVRWVVVKGPVLAARWFAGASLARTYDDLDVLVDPSSLGDAVAALEAVGFRHRNRNWDGFRALGVGEVPLDDGEVVLDLHWHLVGLAADRRGLRMRTDELLDRAVDVRLGGVAARTLDEPDTFVHLCVHHALAGAQRLGHLKDVHAVGASVDPGAAVARVDAAGAARLAAVAVARAERVLGPTVPGGLAPRLGAPGWRSASEVVDLVWARLHPGGRSPHPGAVAAAGRATAAATAGALARRLGGGVRARAGRPTVVSPGGPLDWQVEAGGAQSYARFLGEVASGAFGA